MKILGRICRVSPVLLVVALLLLSQGLTAARFESRNWHQVTNQLTDPTQRSQLDLSLQQLAKRAQSKHLDATEMNGLAAELTRLLTESGGSLPSAQKIRLALEIADLAARPSSVDQGQHNTCALAVLEHQLFVRHPALAAHIIVQIVLAGAWTTPDNKSVSIDSLSLLPGKEEQVYPTPDGWRSYASQVLQLAFLNDIGMRRSHAVAFQYDGTAEYSLDESGNKWAFIGTYELEIEQETARVLADNRVVLIRYSCCMADEYTADVLQEKGTAGDVVLVTSPEQLALVLEQLGRQGRLPAMALVYGGDPAFSGGNIVTDSQTRAATALVINGKQNHFVSLERYSQSMHAVLVDNQWGSKSDRWITVTELIRSMSA